MKHVNQLDLFAAALVSSANLSTAFREPPPLVQDVQPPPRESRAVIPAADIPVIDFRLTGARDLAKSWPGRASDNLAAMTLAKVITEQRRHATADEQAILSRYTGWGATNLAVNMFPLPKQDQKPHWRDLSNDLRSAANDRTWKELAASTRFAHYTPEYIARAMWRAVIRLGFQGGSILEPGCGTLLFPATMPHIDGDTAWTGIEKGNCSPRVQRRRLKA